MAYMNIPDLYMKHLDLREHTKVTHKQHGYTWLPFLHLQPV